jgi:hypothetical protein
LPFNRLWVLLSPLNPPGALLRRGDGTEEALVAHVRPLTAGRREVQAHLGMSS